MLKITRSLILIALMAAAAPRFAAAQNTTPVGPNASEPGAAPATTPAPATAPTAAPADTSSPVSADSTPAPTSHSGSHGLKLGVDYVLYLPTNGHTRDRFGSSWSSIGLGIGSVGQPNAHSFWAPELNFLYQTKGDNHVLAVPIGVTYRTHTGTRAGTQPYTGASLGALIVDLKSKEDNINSGTNVGYYGSVYAGVSFKENYFAEARYYASNKVRSFDLSGVSLSAGIRF